ncbi:hypothetical protein N7535_001535 [Penicillium sp. DV-2018c]|nr:hypothetical protein N7535_001535 [Penicillium sp. DV-2018c]
MATIGVAAHESPRATIEPNEATSQAATPNHKRKQPDVSLKENATPLKKITRACDACKKKKCRCTGTLPCEKCTRRSLPCTYTAEYSRGRPRDPLPATPSPLSAPSSHHAVEGANERASACPNPQGHAPGLAVNGDRLLSNQTQQHAVSGRESPEPGSTDFEGHYLGPASGVSFINRVWSRLHQDETTHYPDELHNESSRNTAVFMFGDRPYSDSQDVGFNLPPLERALELVGIYFDFSVVTYRFVSRGNAEEWTRQVYRDGISLVNPPVGNMIARTAIVLMILAVSTSYMEQKPGISPDSHSESERWYAASKHMSSLESGPPRLETIQVRLGQCLYLLGSSRANECWYSFGMTVQIVTALGLHRKLPAKLAKTRCSYLELEFRKRIFWSVYTLDKYLSIMFGRPRLLHDEDIDQELPGEMSDEDLLEDDPMRRTGSMDSMMIASVLHHRLARILSNISRQLYSINTISRDTPLETAIRLTSELEKWKETVPPLFNSVDPSVLIPPLRRQSQVLQLAYSHAMIHVTRSFLLYDFTDLSRGPKAPHQKVAAHVQKCTKAAEDILTLTSALARQGILIQSFWFTHYVCFYAVLVIYIHTIQQHRRLSAGCNSASIPVTECPEYDKLLQLLSKAESCQQHLAEATRKNCPSRRYGIILEELRQEVHRQIGTPGFPAGIPAAGSHAFDAVRGVMQNGGAGEVPFDGHTVDLPSTGVMQPANAEMDAGDNAGFLESLEGSMWWAQLDSWAKMSSSKKDAARRTLFNLWIPTRAVVPGKPDTSPTDSAATESPATEPIIPGGGRDRIRARLTRSGSKILLVLGLRGSSKSNKDATTVTDCYYSAHGGNESLSPSTTSSPCRNEHNDPGYRTAAEPPQSEPIPVNPSLGIPTKGVGTRSEPLPNQSHSHESLGGAVVAEALHQEITSEDPPSTTATEQRLPTNSKFVDRFSHRLSLLALGHATVIRRPRLRHRPSIHHISPPHSADIADVWGLPLSSGKGKSPYGYKAAVTHFAPSFETNEAAVTSNSKTITRAPSIKTVEAVSVAKVYLEVCFNSIFNDKDSRQRRQLELERHIYAFDLTAEEQLMTRQNWALGETDRLRKYRVLRSKRFCTRSEDTVAAAGYKALTTLGKGSFGVVQLVRQIDSDSLMSNEDGDRALQDNQDQVRYNPLNMSMPAVEIARKPHRRYMTGEKKEVYAMKVIGKSEMIRNCQEGHIRAERDFLVASEASRWIVPLIASFQDVNNLYLVMDYMVGGDFLSLLIRKDTLREDWTKFYIAEMVLCIEEIHRMSWIHRDIKPDNFLISASGHLKISDFGLSFGGHWSHDQAYYHSHRYCLLEKLGITINEDADDPKEIAKAKELAPDIRVHDPNDRNPEQLTSTGLLGWRDKVGRRRFAKSVVGTSQYMAPEVVRGKCMMDDATGGAWASFYTSQYILTYSKHHNKWLGFPRERTSDRMVSPEAIDLIARILQEREIRLCSPKYRANDSLRRRPVSTQWIYSMDPKYRHVPSYFVYPNDGIQIKLHPFFRGIPWQDLHMCQPPMIPRVRGWEDTRYFGDWKLTGELDEKPPSNNSKKAAESPEPRQLEATPKTGECGPADAVQPPTGKIDTATEKAKEAKRAKEKNRPRDKILRDRQMCQTALDIRKKGAFLGYTYRRPNEVVLAVSTERGRRTHTRGQLEALYT